MPTASEYNVAKQNVRELYAKISLLNFNFQIVDELSGVVISDTWNVNATSDIRRTGTLNLIPTDSSFDIKSGNKIWLDKYIQPYIGIKDIHTGEIVYTNMGIYMISNPNETISSTNKEINLQLVDLMAKLTGLRGGNLQAYTYQIPVGSDIRNAIIAILKENGFNKYIIDIQEGDYKETQYDISIDPTGTYYQLLLELCNMNINYQMYFDVEGVFHYERIPDGANEQIFVDDDMWENNVIDYQVNTDFNSLKNSITVIGKTHEVANYCGTVTSEGSVLVGTSAKVQALRNNLKIGFTTPKTATTNPSFNLNNYGAKPIKDEDEKQITKLEPDTYYVIKYKEEGSYWFFMGEVTPMYTVNEDNPNSPFYYKGTVGKIPITLSGGEYDNINTTNLAKQRAEWELYTRCRLLDNISITSVPIYWLNVNKLTRITLPDKTESELYIIKQISTTGGVSGTQSIQMMKYYPFYLTPTHN